MRAVGILGLLAIAAGGCANETVDTQVIEQGIEDQVVAGTTTVSDVKCPGDIQSQKGATFKCDVLFDNGAGGVVEVTNGNDTPAVELLDGGDRRQNDAGGAGRNAARDGQSHRFRANDRRAGDARHGWSERGWRRRRKDAGYRHIVLD